MTLKKAVILATLEIISVCVSFIYLPYSAPMALAYSGKKLQKEQVNSIIKDIESFKGGMQALSGKTSCFAQNLQKIDINRFRNPAFQSSKVKGIASVYGFPCDRSKWPKKWQADIPGRADCLINGNPVFASGKVANKFGENIDVIKLNPNIPLVAYNRLPMGSCVSVTTLSGRKKTFQVLDTGSYDKLGRVIDLSFAAAMELGLKDTTETVSVQAAPCPKGTSYYPLK